MRAMHHVMHGHGLDHETVLGNLHAVENERLGEISHGPVARMFMRKPPLDPDVADTAPADSILTPYDHEHAITYLRLLDADAEGADFGFGFNVINKGKVGLGFKREAAISIARFENRKIFFGAQVANTCKGDSGGPLFVETPDGKTMLLAGVTSGGDANCTYGVDTRFDAFASWIKTRIQ
jgi:hypothetical protein